MPIIFVAMGMVSAGWSLGLAQTPPAISDEFRIKREGPFEFAQKPTVTRAGDRVTVAFETKGLCDVTVAVETATGKILRHLASGVLGPNAPAPFQKDSRKQTIVWDGKNDQGAYIDDLDPVTVRVSLGLRARYERPFLFSTHRRIGPMPSLISAQPEGVYVFEGCGVDWLRLFDHDGNYVRTIYPFPARNLPKLAGVKQQAFPQSGATLPLKWGFYETTLLTSGYSGLWGDYMLPQDGPGASAMAVRDGRVALAGIRVNRLNADGTTGAAPFEGPVTHMIIDKRWYCVPRSAALSPDGKTLYLTGFGFDRGYDHGNHEWIHGVGKVDVATGADGKMEAFAGSLTVGHQFGGSEPGQFKTPSSVDCDPQGRVYVADHFNDRIQVFDTAGKHLKSISIFRPSEVCIDQKTGHLYVFSWTYHGDFYVKDVLVKATLTHLGAFDDLKRVEAWPLQMADQYTEAWTYADRSAGFQYRGAIDSWSRENDRPAVWLVPGGPGGRALAIPGFTDSALGRSAFGGTDKNGNPLPDQWAAVGLKVFRPKEGTLGLARDFGRDSMREMLRPAVPGCWRYRLSVRPTTGELYVLDTSSRPIVIDPATGRERVEQLPFSVEDLAFDINGLAYLRTHREAARYNPDGWKEVPFDYGVERPQVGLWNGRKAGVVSALDIPTGDIWHQGGIAVSPKGLVAVAFYGAQMASGREERGVPAFTRMTTWSPTRFPGRKGDNVIHVWDEHGRIVYEDAALGLGITDGIAMDKDDNLYFLAAATRMLGPARYWDKMTGTLIKVAPKQKVLSTDAPIPLQPNPERPPDTVDGQLGRAWYEGAKWFYGGLYFTGKDGDHAMGGCACWNGRFALDAFARSFAPETQHYSVAVLDTNGNLILRVGQYGNVDDGVPLVSDQRSAVSSQPGTRNPKPETRSIGGDETALFYPVYLATHTDRRLFIADPGNFRIVSVKLDYHATERVALRDVKDGER